MRRHIICYSGGHSSALVAIEVKRKYPKAEVILLNHDIISSSEDPDIKRFKQEVADYLSLPITYCNMPGWDTKDQFDVVIEAGAFKVGNGTALCTNRMKTNPFELWLKQHAADKENVVIYYGFDAKETDRIQRRSSHLALLGFRSAFPLAHWPRTIRSTEDIGISLPNTYALFKHGNCVGCLKAKRQHWYVVYCTRPDIWTKAKMAEDTIGYTIINGISLDELEPMFKQMVEIGIKPSEHIPSSTFWPAVKRLIKNWNFDVPADEVSSLPCECTE